MSRWWAAAAVMLAWFATLGWLVRREHTEAAPAASAAAAARRLAPVSAFYAVELRGRQVGIASSSIDTLPDGVRITFRYDLELPVGDSTRRTVVTEQAVLRRDLALRSFSSTRTSGGVPIVVQGEVESDSVRWQAGRRGEDAIRSTGALAIGGPVVTPFLVPFRIAFGGRFASGAMAHVAFVDPSGAGVGAVVGRIGRDSVFAVTDSAEIVGGHWVGARLDSVRAWRVTLGGPAPAVLWVDRQGQVVDGFTSEGLRLRRTAFELATAAYHPRTRAGGEPGAMSARLAGALLAPPPSRPRLALLLQPAAGDSVWRLGVLAEGRQRLSGDTLVVTHELPGDSAMQPTWTLPYGDSARAAELEASLLAPVTDPQIAARARAIVGAERRPVEAARRLVRWTASLSRDSLGEGWPDARRTLDRRRGDAASHAALFVTAARSVGLPARLVAGAVEHGGRWSMHTWAEVWLGDWVAADPTYGPFPAGASYLRLSVGVPARPLQIVPLFARLDPRPLSSNGIR